jgi:hypothetical protein
MGPTYPRTGASLNENSIPGPRGALHESIGPSTSGGVSADRTIGWLLDDDDGAVRRLERGMAAVCQEGP